MPAYKVMVSQEHNIYEVDSVAFRDEVQRHDAVEFDLPLSGGKKYICGTVQQKIHYQDPLKLPLLIISAP